MADLKKQFHQNYRLTTAKIIYHMPDFEDLLQEFIWQEYDLAPEYPELHGFIDFWNRKIDGKLHSVYVASTKIISTSDYRAADWEGMIH